jgi:protein tyrosine/serine phosphatase
LRCSSEAYGAFGRGPVFAVVLTLLPVFGLGIHLEQLQLSGNVHTIEAGEAYRSAQLDKSRLEAAIGQYGIRSIIALNGSTLEHSWYNDAPAVSEAMEVVRYELPLSANDELSSGQLQELLSLLQKAPKPVLIHCKNGAYRSGLAAAIYEYAIAFRPADVATGQLSIRYGHLPFLWSGTWAMDKSFMRFLTEHEERRD